MRGLDPRIHQPTDHFPKKMDGRGTGERSDAVLRTTMPGHDDNNPQGETPCSRANACAFSPIEGRPPLKFPDGVRLVIWPVLALEDWDISRPMARMVISPPQGQPMLPDHPNWSWHEYGMRVGFWRLRKRCSSASASRRPSRSTPRSARPIRQVVRACMDSGLGTQRAQLRSDADAQARRPARGHHKSMDVIEKFSGQRPRGWFGPGLTQTFDTLDYLSRGRRRIHRRLGARRRAGDAEDDAQAGGGAAVQFRTPRHRHDGAAAPSLRRCSTRARSITSTGSMRKPPNARRSWRSPAIPICPACRTASAMCERTFEEMSREARRRVAGTARKFSTGISAQPKAAMTHKRTAPLSFRTT